MAAVSCWAEHVWLPQSTAAHRHLVLEEAWQILLSPATASLIQRQLKNSRKAALSLDVVMHTLSDLGDGKAQDLARLCEVAHVGRLGPEEAAAVGALLGLPQWAIDSVRDRPCGRSAPATSTSSRPSSARTRKH
jgi:DNA helicase HerA-like ATPase